MRVKGLEPPNLSASDPKSDAAANFATPAFEVHKSNSIFPNKKAKKSFSEQYSFQTQKSIVEKTCQFYYMPDIQIIYEFY